VGLFPLKELCRLFLLTGTTVAGYRLIIEGLCSARQYRLTVPAAWRLLAGTAVVLCLLLRLAEAGEAPTMAFVADRENPWRIALVLDRADKIAGLKVVIAYDHQQLQLASAEKAKEMTSFLHVVNDKTPGRVVVVMASARGISGAELPMVHLTFTPSAGEGKQIPAATVTEVELMDENLQQIAVNKPEYRFALDPQSDSTKEE
jgi:hypothetical protein